MSVSADALNDNNQEERTVVDYDPKNTIKFAIEGLYMIKYRHDVCTDSNGPSVILTTDVVKNAYYDLKRRGIEVRWVTEETYGRRSVFDMFIILVWQSIQSNSKALQLKL